MNSTKIALVSFEHIPYSIHLGNALGRRAEVLMIIPENNIYNYENILNKEVNFFTYRPPRRRHPKYIFILIQILRKIKEFGAEVVHFQGENIWFSIGLPFLKKIKIVTTMHDVTAHPGEKKLRYKWEKWSFRKYSDRIIVHGNYLKKQFLAISNSNHEKVSVIPHGSFDLYLNWKKSNVSEEKSTILFFGRLLKYKGLRYLIEAEPLISREIPELKIVVAIHGEPFSNYEKYIDDRKRFEVIEKGYISNEELAELFQRASVVVLPYISASQSGILNIAYAFGKTVVVTKVGSLVEAVDEGKTGLIVPPADSKALSKAIIKLLKNEDFRLEMGKNAYRKATTEFSWNRIAEKTLRVYGE